MSVEGFFQLYSRDWLRIRAILYVFFFLFFFVWVTFIIFGVYFDIFQKLCGLVLIFLGNFHNW